ncbi:MAG: hypothetical protein CMK89_09710 [Pseudomonadales bacterium]|nr:hypothetical protein [Pseudomonadales bacterium]RLU02234.1 MAG: hypothetical protein D9N11_10245 [Ketobacter sp.]
MVRKLAAAMLGVGVLIPGLANALGLGEIKLNSALSEPLDAEIELVQVRELTSNEILPSLAAQEDFVAANVERYHFLTDLKFEVITNAQGKSVIKVRSRKPVKEPFLNFLVEVNWPAGRLLREYTLFLDPPTYSAQPAAPVSAPTTAATSTGAAQPVTTTYQPTTTAPQSSYSSGGDYSQSAAAGDYTIGSNDSLWSIAKGMKPSDRVSIQQTMLAIQRKNPDAFIDGNINLLKKGAVLRAPSEEEVLQLDNRDAMAIAAEQNRQWRERVGGSEPDARQIDLSGRSVTREQDPAPEADTDRLKLVSAGTSGDSGQGGSAETGQLRDQLSVAEENIDKFKLENEELRLRLSDLEDQLDTSEKVLTLKDEQIAALQAKLRELEAAEQAAAQQPEALEPEAIEPPVEAMPEEVAAEEPEVMPEEEMAGELVSPETGEEVDYNFAEEPAAEEPMAPADDMMAAEPAEPADVAGMVEEPSQPAEQPKPQPLPQEKDMLSQILENPLYLAAGGGAILLLIVLGLLAARRKQSADEFEEEIPEEFDLPESQGEEGLMELDSVNLEEDDAFEEAVEASAEEETVPQTADVIGEADIYIAYGRFPQAIEMLEKAAENEPDRADIRLKLCEVCAEANEPEVFMNHYRVLQDVGSVADVSKADTLREKLGGVADVAPEEPSDDFGGDETLLAESAGDDFDFDSLEPADAEDSSIESELEQESDTGLDFDLGDLEDTGASFTSESETTEEPADSKSAEVAGLDFDLNLNLDEEQTEEDTSSTLDFDLDSSFGSGEVSTADDAAKGDSDEVSLDFDTDFSLDDVPASQPSLDEAPEFEAPESLEAPEQAEDQSEDNAMDFDLDFDSSTTELDETPTMDFSEAGSELETPEEPEAASEEEPMLDSQTAAQLADELDLDLDGDFLDSPSLDTEEPSVPEEAAPEEDQTIIANVPPPVAPSTPAANDMSDSGDELDFLSDADEASTKLDLARAYIDMGDRDGAKDILDEVMIEGNDNQKTEAKELLTRLES